MWKLTRRQAAALLAAALLVGTLGAGAVAVESDASGEQSLDVSQTTGVEGSEAAGSGSEDASDASTGPEDGSGSPEEEPEVAGDSSQEEEDSSADPDSPQGDSSGDTETGGDAEAPDSSAQPGQTPELPGEAPGDQDILPEATIGDPPLDSDAGSAMPVLPGLDAVGSISLPNIRSRIREHNLDYLSLEGSIRTIEEIDYDETYEDLREAMNSLASAQWGIVQMGSMGFIGDYEKNSSLAAMDQQYAAMREQFDAIKDGEMQKDNADVVRQLRNLQNQIVLGGETMYIALEELEQSTGTLKRNLATLDRTIEEMEMRYRLGQISAMTLQETKGNRTSLVSGQKTLDMNIRNLKYQLESLLGAEMKGTIRLSGLPDVTGEQISGMNLEKDLETAKKNSYALYDAALTYEDAQDTFKDTANYYAYNEERMEFRQAQREWQTAQNTYRTTVQNFELSFRTLYEQVKDYKQVLDASRTALAVKKSNYQASELKYKQGNISKNALLNSQDEVDAAQETVNGAVLDLFSAYNTYRWAVDYGILN